MNHFSIRLWCVTKSGFCMTASDNQFSGWIKALPKHFPKPNLPHKMSWSLFGGLLLVWSTTAFLILAKPLHLRSMLSKLIKWTQNCNLCSQHLVNRMGPILHDNTQLFVAQPILQKWNKLGYKISPHLPYSPCYRDWACSAYCRIRHEFERWGVEAKNMTLIQEDGTLTSQNNHLSGSRGQVLLWIRNEGEARK